MMQTMKGIFHICQELGRKCFFDPEKYASCPYCKESFVDKIITEYQVAEVTQ